MSSGLTDAVRRALTLSTRTLRVHLKPRATPKRVAADRLAMAQRIVAWRMKPPRPKSTTSLEAQWHAVLDRCAQDFGKRKGLQPYLAAVHEGRSRKRRVPIWAYARKRSAVKRLGLTFDAAGVMNLTLHDGIMVALQPDLETAARLAVPGGEPPESLHLTLAYVPAEALGEATVETVTDAMLALAKTRDGPLEGRIGGIGRFTASDTSDGEDVLFAIADVPELAAFREQVIAALTKIDIEPSEAHGFVPHLTLAFLFPESPWPVTTVEGIPLRFNDLVVVQGDRWFTVPFGRHDA